MPSEQFRLPDTLANWPWPRAINPHYEECKIESAAWCEGYHAFSSKAQVAFNLCDFNLLASLAYPIASKDGCRIGCDLMNLFFVYDEHSDAMDEASVRVWAEIIMDALRNPQKPRPKGEPIVGEITRTFWLNALKTASPQSQRRFIDTFDAYTQSVIQQAEDRTHGVYRDVESYMSLRRATIGALPSFALLEMDMELPDEVINHPLIVNLTTWCIDMLVLGNDLCSYNVEQSRGDDIHNIVKLIMVQEDIDLHGAMDFISNMHEELVDNFLKNYNKLPSWGKKIDAWVHRYVDGLGNWVRANDAWSFESWRYFKNDGLRIQEERWVTILPPVESTEELTSSIPPESRYILSTIVPGRPRPENVGIVAMDMYFPKRCVSEKDLEVSDGVPSGKYTMGLGQEYMAFVDDREDINSFALSVVSSLLRKYNIDPRSIGRIDVGTETILDKSKSVKSHLMDLFASCGNTDIEGIDSKHACYGSTAALFNAINWIESASWDGRYAIVFAGDIAIYAEGSARPVGGAGACAMLIGPNAPIVVEPVHGTYMANTYDFYKPTLDSEYPEVDGVLSLDTYLTSLDNAYESFCQKHSRFNPAPGSGETNADAKSKAAISLASFDYMIFHSPYGKLVQKEHARLVSNEFTLTVVAGQDPQTRPKPTKEMEKSFMQLAVPLYAKSVAPSMMCAKRIGNMYTGSLYGGLASLLSSVGSDDLQNKRVSMFAFGSGAAASFFSIRIVGNVSRIQRMVDIQKRLDSMQVVPCSDFFQALKLREKSHNAGRYSPEGGLENILPRAFYLHDMDERRRRSYVQMQ